MIHIDSRTFQSFTGRNGYQPSTKSLHNPRPLSTRSEKTESIPTIARRDSFDSIADSISSTRPLLPTRSSRPLLPRRSSKRPTHEPIGNVTIVRGLGHAETAALPEKAVKDANGNWRASDYDTSSLSPQKMEKLRKKGVNPALYLEMKAGRKQGHRWLSPLTTFGPN